jgi:glycosyltransferase involved in cell wall biosynthesis
MPISSSRRARSAQPITRVTSEARMKVVLCAGWYLPESAGGTEHYVHALALELRALGVECVVMAPVDGDRERHYTHEGVEVVRYPVPPARSLEQHRGERPHSCFERFGELLAATDADVFHLHSLTYGCNAHHLARARALGMRTLTTFHVPGVVCARGTMMRWGREACDGRMLAGRCSVCWAQARGVPRGLGRALEQTWIRFGPALAGAGGGPVRTLLQIPARISAAHATLLRIAELSDRLIAVCNWLCDALVLNGIAAQRITTCRQGVQLPPSGAERGPRPRSEARPALRVAFFGRAAAIKGLDTLVRAVRALPPACDLALDVYALQNSPEDAAALARSTALATGDPRIRFVPPAAAGRVQETMRDYDVIAIPSRWLETGPIVAMEALAAGVPVLGSDLGGIAELVAHGETGWLVPAEDVGAWSRQLERLCMPGVAELRFELGAAPLIAQRTVAERMHALYAAPP